MPSEPFDAVSLPDDSLSAAVEDLRVVDEDLLVDEESVAEDDEPDGWAYAIPGVFAMATPTPRVTASAPTRPMYLA